MRPTPQCAAVRLCYFTVYFPDSQANAAPRAENKGICAVSAADGKRYGRPFRIGAGGRDCLGPARRTERAGRGGARCLGQKRAARTAAEDSILPGRLSETLLGQWDYDAERSLDLGRKDRSAIYGGFHIYRKKP